MPEPVPALPAVSQLQLPSACPEPHGTGPHCRVPRASQDTAASLGKIVSAAPPPCDPGMGLTRHPASKVPGALRAEPAQLLPTIATPAFPTAAPNLSLDTGQGSAGCDPLPGEQLSASVPHPPPAGMGKTCSPLPRLSQPLATAGCWHSSWPCFQISVPAGVLPGWVSGSSCSILHP